MKKILTLLLTLLMVFTLVGCNSKQDSPVVEESQQQEVVETAKEEPEVVGGFVDVEDKTLTDELKDIFTKALEGLTGASYEPQELVATQVVAGTNYKFLANGTKTTNPITKGTYYITIYKDLEGNVKLLDIETIEEKQEEKKTVDPTQYSYWVVVYDQFGNELSRTTTKYGATVKDPDGNDVVVKGNTYFDTYVNYVVEKDDEPAPTPTPTPVTKTPGLYKDGVLVKTWNEFVASYPNAFDGTTGTIKAEVYDEFGVPGQRSYFYNLSDVDELVIDGSIKTIGTNAFSNCNGIKSIVLIGVEAIEGYAFQKCNSLESITLSDDLTTIGDLAFSYCLNLSSLTIPKNVNTIGTSIIKICSNLNTLSVDQNNSKYDSRNNCNAIIETSTNKLIVSCNNTIIPNDVKIIGKNSFDTNSITSINLPNDLETIEEEAFYNSSLESITIPNSVTVIGTSAFSSCSNLESVILPNSLISIPDSLFSFCCSLSSVDIPNSVEEIGADAFYNCTDLTSITIPNTVTTIGNNAFSYVPHIVYSGSATGSPWGAMSIN